VTDTCKYRRRGKVCRRVAAFTLIGYGIVANSNKGLGVMRDLSIRNAFSYCPHCARLIAKRCTSTTFVDDNGGLARP
jgi:hypothetical protein